MESMMDMPVVAATRLEGHVEKALCGLLAFGKILRLEGSQVTVPTKVVRIGIIGIAFRPIARLGISCMVCL